MVRVIMRVRVRVRVNKGGGVMVMVRRGGMVKVRRVWVKMMGGEFV